MATLRFRQVSRGLDLGLLTVAVLLTLIGLGAIFSTTLNTAEPTFIIFFRQLGYAGIGLLMVVFVVRVDYRSLGGIHWVLYGLAILSLVAVRLFGKTVNGTTGWFELGGFQLQPIEFVNIIVCFVLAKYFADHADDMSTWKLILSSGGLVAVPVMLVILQPDYGSVMLMIGIWFGLLFALPVPRRRLVAVLLVAVLVGVSSWFLLLRPYQKDRLLNFVSPGRDPQRSGYNITQAITAIGSGQLVGRGLGLGPQSQLSFLPERQTDFIFAAISEELGFIGSATVVLLFSILCWRCFSLSQRCRDNFSIVLSLGLALLFFIQVTINISMNLGIFPVTGIPLPFISYGGSSLLASFIAIGILEGISVRQRILPL